MINWMTLPWHVVTATHRPDGSPLTYTNIRSGAAISAPLRGQLRVGDRIKFSGVVIDGWKEIFASNVTGWAHGDYFDTKPEDPTPYIAVELPTEILELLADEKLRLALVATLHELANAISYRFK